ncbi:hypothetical protein NEOLI_000398 [Neolecta irregularis DAH-3]|uniref:Uncharacterized protein n=1 Tax=Neolecta irregularis (strain DAH-3) TaxID=1198029 RepID=A0A1U7LUX9_NEOID|nr:hypothetical protein NEOLI_000398 [Neolecta irregularis DAH-3]|eukprot:OLL26321.1 hypothetical protein NEOLI_000398 [Neolecta irregularis DAH-3]
MVTPGFNQFEESHPPSSYFPSGITPPIVLDNSRYLSSPFRPIKETIPHSPLISRVQVFETPTPRGVTSPSPVTTTLLAVMNLLRCTLYFYGIALLVLALSVMWVVFVAGPMGSARFILEKFGYQDVPIVQLINAFQRGYNPDNLGAKSRTTSPSTIGSLTRMLFQRQKDQVKENPQNDVPVSNRRKDYTKRKTRVRLPTQGPTLRSWKLQGDTNYKSKKQVYHI